MAVRGSTLATLQTRVRDVIPGQSTTGANTDNAITKALNRARVIMFTKFLWPHLRIKTELSFTGGKTSLPSDFYSPALMRDVNETEWTKYDPMKFDLNSGNIWAIEEESAISRTISTAVIATNIATITTSADHLYQVGDSITQSGVGSATFNETITIDTTPSATTYTYAKVAGDESSTAGTALRDKSDKIFIKPTGTSSVFLWYYKTLSDLSAAADQSEFFPHQEQVIVWGAERFLALRDRDFKTLALWEQEFEEEVSSVYQQAVDDDEEDQGIQTVFDKQSMFRTTNIRRISS